MVRSLRCIEEGYLFGAAFDRRHEAFSKTQVMLWDLALVLFCFSEIMVASWPANAVEKA